MAEILFEDRRRRFGLSFRFPTVDVRDEQGHRIHQVQHEKVSKKVREELQKAIDAYESCLKQQTNDDEGALAAHAQAINQAQSLKSSPLKGAESRDSPKPPGQKRKEAGEAASEAAGPRRSKQSKSDGR